MGINYVITFSRGILIKNIKKKNLIIPEWIHDFNIDYIINDDSNNLFISHHTIKTFYCGGYDKSWNKYGITNFLSDDKECYVESHLDSYENELLKIYQEIKKPLCVNFCRISHLDFPEEATLLKIKNIDMNKLVNKIFCDLSKEEELQLKKLLEHAVYGDVKMKSYHP